MRDLEIFIFSVFSSTVSPIFGIGGGMLNVPFLTLHIGAGFAAATSASLLAGVFLSLSASAHNIPKRQVGIREALSLLPAFLAGSLLSAYAPVPEKWLFLLFALIIASISAFLLLFPGFKARQCHPFLALPLLFMVGITTGMLGIGGGAILVPLLMLTRNFEIKKAIATANFMTVFGMGAGFISYLLHGDLDLSIALPLAFPAIFMGYVGASIMAERIQGRMLEKAFAGFLLLIALAMAWKSFAG